MLPPVLSLIAALLFAPSLCGAAGALDRASASSAAKPLDYVCYSPYRDGQAPGGAEPSEAQIRADLALIAPLAKSGNPAIKGLIVGNEVLLRGDVPAARLLAYLQRVREAKTGIPITTSDIYQDLIDHAAELDPAIDFALCHAHPYWEAVDAGGAAARVLEAWNGVKAKYPGKRVLVGETGFPTAGQAQGAAVPGDAGLGRRAGDDGTLAADAKREPSAEAVVRCCRGRPGSHSVGIAHRCFGASHDRAGRRRSRRLGEGNRRVAGTIAVVPDQALNASPTRSAIL